MFVVKPKGKIQRHDINWSTKISELISNGFSIEDSTVKAIANKYWTGEPSNEPVWEYTCENAVILKVFDWFTDQDLNKELI